MNPFNKLIILNLGVNELKCFMKKGPAIFQLLKNPLSFKDRIYKIYMNAYKKMKAYNGLGENVILYIFSKTKE